MLSALLAAAALTDHYTQAEPVTRQMPNWEEHGQDLPWQTSQLSHLCSLRVSDVNDAITDRNRNPLPVFPIRDAAGSSKLDVSSSIHLLIFGVWEQQYTLTIESYIIRRPGAPSTILIRIRIIAVTRESRGACLRW